MPPSVGRRRLLATCTGALTTLAGCSVLDASPDEEPARLGAIVLHNRHDVEHTVHLTVEHDDELVYWQDHTLVSASTGSNTRMIERFRCDQGAFRVRGRLDGRSEWRTVETVPGDTKGVFFTIHEDGAFGFGRDSGDAVSCVDPSTSGE